MTFFLKSGYNIDGSFCGCEESLLVHGGSNKGALVTKCMVVKC